MVEQLSPLAPIYRQGSFGNVSEGAGVRLSETRPGSIVQVAAWPGAEKSVISAIKAVTGLALPDGAGGGIATDAASAFGFAPGKFLVADRAEGLAARISEQVPVQIGSVTDLSHGRNALRIEGAASGWVLAKLFALDFSLPAFPVGAGRATIHHDISALIQRRGDDGFELYVFRSFARSFWKVLGHAAEEVGFEVG